MHAEELPDFSAIEINGLGRFRTVIHAEELPRCTLKNSRKNSGNAPQVIDFSYVFQFCGFPPVFFFPVLSPKEPPPLGATPRRLLRASRSARAYGAPTRHPQGLCPSAFGLTPFNRPPKGAKQIPRAVPAAPRALPGVGPAAPRPPVGFAPLCALRRTAPPDLKTRKGGQACASKGLVERPDALRAHSNSDGKGLRALSH